ncbi:MAG: PpiC-type peptidyl-prolyl cis-trans isomerase [Paenibacillus sp.]|nr:PpiC-type peptidyl-prolyl cis-trans isomerase [Paenibacillus sp.]
MKAKYKDNSKKWMSLSIALFIILVGMTIFAFTRGGDKNDVIASVNGVHILKEKFYDEMVSNNGNQILNSLIQEELVKQEADKAGVRVTDADLEKELAYFKKTLGVQSDDEFNMMLQQYGMTKEQIKEQMPMQVRLRKMFEPKATVTEDDMKKYYDENKDKMATPEQVKASHILVSTKEESESILAQLKSGADFAKLASEKSIDPGSKTNGGDLSYFSKGTMVPAFEDAAFSLPVGQLSEVVQTEHGYHIIKVTDKKPASIPTYDTKKNDIRETLVEKQIQEMAGTMIQDASAKAKITNNLPQPQ